MGSWEGKKAAAERQRDNTRTAICRYALAGLTTREIGARLGLHNSVVGKRLQEIRAEWARERIELFQQLLDEVVAKRQLLYRQYLEGWQRSTIRRRKAKEGEEGQAEADGKITERVAGDPRFLDGASRELEHIAQYGGINPRLNITGKEGQDVAFNFFQQIVLEAANAPDVYIDEKGNEVIAEGKSG